MFSSSVYESICLFLCLSVCPSACLPVRLPACPPVCLPDCLPAGLPVTPPSKITAGATTAVRDNSTHEILARILHQNVRKNIFCTRTEIYSCRYVWYGFVGHIRVLPHIPGRNLSPAQKIKSVLGAVPNMQRTCQQTKKTLHGENFEPHLHLIVSQHDRGGGGGLQLLVELVSEARWSRTCSMPCAFELLSNKQTNEQT